MAAAAVLGAPEALPAPFFVAVAGDAFGGERELAEAGASALLGGDALAASAAAAAAMAAALAWALADSRGFFRCCEGGVSSSMGEGAAGLASADAADPNAVPAAAATLEGAAADAADAAVGVLLDDDDGEATVAAVAATDGGGDAEAVALGDGGLAAPGHEAGLYGSTQA